jgi:hypothetical protein
MATHLQQPAPTAPDELCVFDPTEWTQLGESSWFPAYRRWKSARRQWSEQHPDGDLGDVLEQMRQELEVREQMERECPEPGEDHGSKKSTSSIG